jgi:hypothetical protein
MRIGPNRIIFALAAVCALFIVAVATNLQKQPRDVVDYYLLLPDRYLLLGGGAQERDAAIKIRDIKNGYLRIEGAWKGYTEIALFRNPDLSALIAVSNVSFSPGPDQKIYFLFYDGKTWLDKTNGVFTRVPQSQIAAVYKKKKSQVDDDYGNEVPHLYRLPRVGTTIEVVTPPGFASVEIILAELRWVNGKFEIAPPST